ncbi:MAG TPA: ribosome biogenesis factor YjgA [Steroidobacteraceae bacterium]|nr:ribosome biogenesis factor YjgA [Steroidobacteraceae bacterium]
MANENEAGNPSESALQHPSKSLRKRQADSLQELGVELAALADQEINGLDLPENLVAALLALRRLPSHGAQLRQRQYIGRLMRTIDPDPVIAKLAVRKRRHDGEIRKFQQIERWRDRLLAGEPGALEELLAAQPGADRSTLAALVGKARRERDEQRAPAGARGLFAYLRQLLD